MLLIEASTNGSERANWTMLPNIVTLEAFQTPAPPPLLDSQNRQSDFNIFMVAT